MATAAQNQAATTAAIQAAATADLALLNSLIGTQGANFNAILNALTSMIPNLSSTARQQQVQSIHDSLIQVEGTFNTLVSTTNAAQTAIPIA